MFGSSFFYIHSSSSTTFYAPCILAVNPRGLHFLHKNTHVRTTHTLISVWLAHGIINMSLGEKLSFLVRVKSDVYSAGADGSRPPCGGAGQSHPEAQCWNQLSVCGPNCGGHEHTAGHSAAARAGVAADNWSDKFWCLKLGAIRLTGFLHRAWSCVELLPCRLKIWCLWEKRGSLCHPAKSPCCDVCTCFILCTNVSAHVHVATSALLQGFVV